MEFLIPPLEVMLTNDRIIDLYCPRNTVAGCGCPRLILEP